MTSTTASSLSLQDSDSEKPNGHRNPHKPDVVPPGIFRGKDEIQPGTFRGGDEIQPGTFRGSIIYRTKDGQADYAFSIERQSDGSLRTYIQAQPSYQGRASDGHSTHRYTEGGRNFICWDRPITSESGAREVAAKWADSTQEYIRKGNLF